jgi:hypothetical protein
MAQLAGYPAAGLAFDPYAGERDFLLAAFIFKDVAVSAFTAAATQLTNLLYVDAVAGILVSQAHHAALIRTTLHTSGHFSAARQFSDARGRLYGAVEISSRVYGTTPAANFAPVDANGRVHTRTPAQVLNVLYVNGAATTGGGFLPSGANGSINMSAASNG